MLWKTYKAMIGKRLWRIVYLLPLAAIWTFVACTVTPLLGRPMWEWAKIMWHLYD